MTRHKSKFSIRSPEKESDKQQKILKSGVLRNRREEQKKESSTILSQIKSISTPCLTPAKPCPNPAQTLPKP